MGLGLSMAKVTDVEKVQAPAAQTAGFLGLTHPNSHMMKAEFQQIMKHKTKQHAWPSTSLATLFQQVCATEWAFKYFQDPDLQASTALNKAWLTCLVGGPGSVVASSAQGRIFVVLAKADFSFLAWELQVDSSAQGSFSLVDALQALSWQHVWDLDDWLEVPCQAKLKSDFGPLVLQQVAEPVPLLLARIQQGLNLTARALKDLLVHYEQPFYLSASKSDLQQQLFELFLDTPEGVQKAQESSRNAIGETLVEVDSDLEDLVELLDDAEENRGDPDLKQEKEKIRKRKSFAASSSTKEVSSRKSKRAGNATLVQSLVRKARLGLKKKHGPKARRKAKDKPAAATLNTATELARGAAVEAVPSSALPPESAASSSCPVPVEAASPAPSPFESSGSRPYRSKQKVYSSPGEVLDQLAPPLCRFMLNNNDHRWVSAWKFSSELWIDDLAHKTFSRSFNSGSVEDAFAKLQEVHCRAWEKFHIAKAQLPTCEEQEPGIIPLEIKEALVPILKGLPPLKQYGKCDGKQAE